MAAAAAGRTPLAEIQLQPGAAGGASSGGGMASGGGGGGTMLSPFEGGLGLGSAARLPRLTQGGTDDELMAPLVMDWELPTQHSGGDGGGAAAGAEGTTRRLSSAGSQALPATGGCADAMPSAPGSPWGWGGRATTPWGGRATPATSSGGRSV
jgi:hypothetical protein